MEPQAAFVVDGGTPLVGEVRVHAAKNSALYLILASLLTDEPALGAVRLALRAARGELRLPVYAGASANRE